MYLNGKIKTQGEKSYHLKSYTKQLFGSNNFTT